MTDDEEFGALGRADAKRLTKQIKATFTQVNSGLNMLSVLVIRAKAGDAHLALGYRSWTEYVSGEFAGLSLRLDREDRRELVAMLAGEGMSTRAIAPVVGADRETVASDLRGGRNLPPDREVTGLDGKAYTRPQPIPEAVREDHKTAVALKIQMGAANRHLSGIAELAENVDAPVTGELRKDVLAWLRHVRAACDRIGAALDREGEQDR
jgi:hypothetical protein